MLENTRLDLVNAQGTACMQAAGSDRLAECTGTGINTVRTLDTPVGTLGGGGDLSFSDSMFVNPVSKQISIAGNLSIVDGAHMMGVGGSGLALQAVQPTVGR